jgi:hypothetical protein
VEALQLCSKSCFNCVVEVGQKKKSVVEAEQKNCWYIYIYIYIYAYMYILLGEKCSYIGDLVIIVYDN